MKTITLFILLLFVEKQPQKINNGVLLCKNIQQTEKIVGGWQRCRTQYKSEFEEHNVLSNVCLTIIFNEDGKGKVLMGDELRLKFKWKIEGELMIFSFNSSKDRSNFLSGETEYSYKQYHKENIEYLELKPKDINGVETIHFLSR